MTRKFSYNKFSDFIFIVIILYFPVFAYKNNQPVFKAEIGSAYYFQIPDSGQFQFGPSLLLNTQLYKTNSIEVEVEHIYWEEEIPKEHYAQRAVVINLQWKRYFSRGFWGLGYLITPNKLYNQDKQTYLVEENMSVGLLGLGGFMSFTEEPLTFKINAKFSNSDNFKASSGFMYYFEASIKLKLLRLLSVSFEYWRWYNTVFYNDMYQSAISPYLNISWKGFIFDFGPVFSASDYPSAYKNKFTFYGRFGYVLLKRKKEK